MAEIPTPAGRESARVETLLEALAFLRGDGAGLRLVLAGDLEGDSFLSAAASVREQVGRLGLEEQVILPGFVVDSRP